MPLLYASQKSFGGIKTVLLKKVELMIAANPVCIYSTLSRWFSNFGIKMNVEMFPKI